MNRQARQRRQILLLADHGEVSRAVALGHEHLAEFPDDEHVAAVVGGSARRDLAPREALEDLG